jgi:hypothetical protein
MGELKVRILWTLLLSPVAGLISYLTQRTLGAWGGLDPFAATIGGWLGMHVTASQAGWTLALGFALTLYGLACWLIWTRRQAPAREGAFAYGAVSALLSSASPDTRQWLEIMLSGRRPTGMPDSLWRPLEAAGLVWRNFTGYQGIVSGFEPAIRKWLREDHQVPVIPSAPNPGQSRPQSVSLLEIAGITESGTWTPRFTFEVPGDLRVQMRECSAHYRSLGDLYWMVDVDLTMTIEFSTASGDALITGLPYSVASPGLPFEVHCDDVADSHRSMKLVGEFKFGTGIWIRVSTSSFRSGSTYRLRFSATHKPVL